MFEDIESFKAFRVFNVSHWSLDQDTDQMLNADIKNIEILFKSFEHVLQGKKYNLKEAKKEWKKVSKRKLSEKILGQCSLSIPSENEFFQMFSGDTNMGSRVS